MKSPTNDLSLDSRRLRELAAELSVQAPQWAQRLTGARSDQEVLEIARKLLDLSQSVAVEPPTAEASTSMDHRIHRFIADNLHRGVTLKVLSAHLGYSEKYCSDLFHNTMGMSFSDYLRQRRLEKAHHLLTATQQTFGQIAAALGFSDQYSFSHFFKRAAGCAPLHIRRQHHPTPRRRPSLGRNVDA